MFLISEMKFHPQAFVLFAGIACPKPAYDGAAAACKCARGYAGTVSYVYDSSGKGSPNGCTGKQRRATPFFLVGFRDDDRNPVDSPEPRVCLLTQLFRVPQWDIQARLGRANAIRVTRAP